MPPIKGNTNLSKIFPITVKNGDNHEGDPYKFETYTELKVYEGNPNHTTVTTMTGRTYTWYIQIDDLFNYLAEAYAEGEVPDLTSKGIAQAGLTVHRPK